MSTKPKFVESRTKMAVYEVPDFLSSHGQPDICLYIYIDNLLSEKSRN